MHKHDLSAESMQADAVQLARRVAEYPLRPTFMLGLWRGGAGCGGEQGAAGVIACGALAHDFTHLRRLKQRQPMVPSVCWRNITTHQAKSPPRRKNPREPGAL